MKFIDEIDIKGKRVFLRADLNVPFDDQGNIADDNRIQAVIPTLTYALKERARVILTSHLGRPKGKRVESLSLRPVAKRLSELLKLPVPLNEEIVGSAAIDAVEKLQPGNVLLLENLRFLPGEDANDSEFAKQLAALCDVYINDAFATSHQKNASVVALPKLMAVKGGGFTLKSELEYFAKAFENPKRPFVAVFGGAKVSTKMQAIKNVGLRADKIIIGGAMANTFFAADGLQVGKSLYEPEEVENARAIKADLTKRGCKLFLPVDVVVASELKSGAATSVVAIDKIPADRMALDVGPKSIESFQSAMSDAETIIWNGPMGAFETAEFSAGTFAIVDLLSEAKALTVVGGGDTDLALHQKHAFDKMDYVSTGGGAFLKLLEGSPLPAVEALK